MAINPLPQVTIHLLGSTQALTTPTSLVKELVENALDAKASSIDILISSTTIDKIEVRDNGHGIQQEDLDLLGRRGHTSKLRSFDELKSIGGTSLGFRGEALASAVQLGDVTVTTRTEGESVATAVKLKASGGIDSQSRTSHPIGTTVCVTKFMHKLPVRKQTFLKESSKTVAKTKELLQAYALARPSIKFSFKVLKESKGSWSYVPRPNDGIKEAVSQIIGKDAASQCISKSARFPERTHDIDDIAELGTNFQISEASPRPKSNDFVVEVFLPRRDADPSKIGHGQYISVDSRPVSHEKNTMKKIVTIFKYYIKGTLSEASEKTKSPFLRLNIICPVGSYDPNVEPAKNDVIFGNESAVLEAIENLFKEVYGAPKTISSISPQQLLKEKLDNFELLLARKPAAFLAGDSPSSPTSGSVLAQTPEVAVSKNLIVASSTTYEMARSSGSPDVDNQEIDEPGNSSKRKWAIDMSKDLSEEVESFERPSHQIRQSYNLQIPDHDTKTDPKNSLNPWIIAKMSAPVQQRDQCTIAEASVSCPVTQPAVDILRTPEHSSDPIPPDSDSHFPSTYRNRPRQTFRNDDIRSLVVPSVQNFAFQRPDPVSIQKTNLQLNRRSLTSDGNDEVLLDGDDSGTQIRRNDFVSARNISEAALLSPPPTLGSKRAMRGMNKPFIPPMRSADTAASEDGLRQTKLITDYRASQACNSTLQDPTEQQENLDLQWSMDFELRKEAASRRRRDELRAAALEIDDPKAHEVVRTSPYKNRYNAAIAALEAGHPSPRKVETVKEPFKTSLPDGDPRAYLMRRQKSVMSQKAKSGEAPKLTRAKSNRLPLENVPENEKTHNLVLEMSADMSSLQRITRELLKSDVYVRTGNESLGLLIGGLETTGVVSRVQAVVSKWMKGEGKENCEVKYMFENLLLA